jgi:hypothetical protein
MWPREEWGRNRVMAFRALGATSSSRQVVCRCDRFIGPRENQPVVAVGRPCERCVNYNTLSNIEQRASETIQGERTESTIQQHHISTAADSNSISMVSNFVAKTDSPTRQPEVLDKGAQITSRCHTEVTLITAQNPIHA